MITMNPNHTEIKVIKVIAILLVLEISRVGNWLSSMANQEEVSGNMIPGTKDICSMEPINLTGLPRSRVAGSA